MGEFFPFLTFCCPPLVFSQSADFCFFCFHFCYGFWSRPWLSFARSYFWNERLFNRRTDFSKERVFPAPSFFCRLPAMPAGSAACKRSWRRGEGGGGESGVGAGRGGGRGGQWGWRSRREESELQVRPAELETYAANRLKGWLEPREVMNCKNMLCSEPRSWQK